MLFQGGGHWHRGRRTNSRVYTDQEIYRHALRVLNQCPEIRTVTNLAVSVYDLEPQQPEQASIFDGTRQDPVAMAEAIDSVNDKYGQFVITPALMMSMNDTILDRIAFGGVKELEDMYENQN